MTPFQPQVPLLTRVLRSPRHIRRKVIVSFLSLLAVAVTTYVIWGDATTATTLCFSASYVLGGLGSWFLYRRMEQEGGTSALAVALKEEHRAWAIKCFLVALAIGQLGLSREGLDWWLPEWFRGGLRFAATLAVMYAHLSLVYVDSLHRDDMELARGRAEAARLGYGEEGGE